MAVVPEDKTVSLGVEAGELSMHFEGHTHVSILVIKLWVLLLLQLAASRCVDSPVDSPVASGHCVYSARGPSNAHTHFKQCCERCFAVRPIKVFLQSPSKGAIKRLDLMKCDALQPVALHVPRMSSANNSEAERSTRCTTVSAAMLQL
jgi:hypothetical protein